MSRVEPRAVVIANPIIGDGSATSREMYTSSILFARLCSVSLPHTMMKNWKVCEAIWQSGLISEDLIGGQPIGLTSVD